LLNIEDLCSGQLIQKKDRILIDIRPFETFSVCMMKGSFQMDGNFVEELAAHQAAVTAAEEAGTEVPAEPATLNRSKTEIYVTFLTLYLSHYPDNYIVIIGD